MPDYTDELLRRRQRSPLQRIGRGLQGVGMGLMGKPLESEGKESPYTMMMLRELMERGRPLSPSDRKAQMDIEERKKEAAYQRKLEEELAGKSGVEAPIAGGVESPTDMVPPTREGGFESRIREAFPGDTTVEDIPQRPTPEDILSTPPEAPISIEQPVAKSPVPKYEIITLETGKLRKQETEASKSARKLWEQAQTAKVKTTGQIEIGQRAAINNLDLVTGAFREMAQTYSDAVKEGGMGGQVAKRKSDMALWWGEEWGEKYPSTAAWPGQKTEVITRMMPMLTQQGDKPGSVRLVSTVFKRLELTVPEKNTPPKAARTQMEKSIRNMYRFARAAQRIGLTNEKVEGMSEQERTMLSNKIATIAQTIDIAGTEKTYVDNMIGSVLAPIDALIKERGVEKGQRFTVNGKRYNIPPEEVEGFLADNPNARRQ